MALRKDGWTDEGVELIVGNFLRAGIIVASVFVVIGGIFYLAIYGTDAPNIKSCRHDEDEIWVTVCVME